MFLIEPFIWMFKTEYFKRHFLYLILTAVCCWTLFIVYFGFTSTLTGLTFVEDVIIKIIAVLIIIIPLLCITGYFWCLTDNIISREQEPQINNIYDGKAGFVNKITLPEWDLPRFVWRGVASIVATIIMYIPLALLVIAVAFNIGMITSFWNINPDQAQLCLALLMLFIGFFVPGLLWNYARRDSVFAVLNLPKAIYLTESYPGSYCLNTFLFIVFSILRSLIIRSLAVALGISSYIACANGTPTFTGTPTPDAIIPIIIFAIISFIVGIYWLFVNAYLLGTIAPPSEG